MRIPFSLDATVGELEVLDSLSMANGKAGKQSVAFRANVYVHDPDRIRNPVVLNEEELPAFAASFKGQPFLADHAREQLTRGGTIKESELIEKDGKKVIAQTIVAVKPWAMEGVLDGTIDRFSIGWYAQEYICTVCNVGFGGDGCQHDFWDLGRKDPKTGAKVRVLMKGLEGIETSAVTHPAVPGTGLEALHQLCEWKNVSGNRAGAYSQEVPMLERLVKLLGLQAGASEPEALIALEARLSEKPDGVPKALRTALGVTENATPDEVIAKVVGLTAPGNYIPREEHDKVADELSTFKANEAVRTAIAQGKVTPAMESWAKEFAKRDPVSFTAYVAHAPRLVPLPSAGVEQPRIEDKRISGGLTEDESLVANRMRLTPAEFEKDKQLVTEYEAKFAATN
jgi:hypothetical protein